MSKESKYFYSRDRDSSFSSRSQPQVAKWQNDMIVEVDENVDFHQYISLTIDKLPQKGIRPPKSNKYLKVDPILPDVFLKIYNLALRLIADIDVFEGEFYLTKHDKDWYVVEYFSLDEKHRWNISIDLRDGVDNLWLMLSSSPGHKGRPQTRKRGTPISIDEFKQHLNLTLKFLSDPDSYKVFLDDYLKNFYALCSGDSDMQGFLINAEVSFDKILDQLASRKSYIEKRLIEVDTDTDTERNRLRGELTGINYAINVIKENW